MSNSINELVEGGHRFRHIMQIHNRVVLHVQHQGCVAVVDKSSSILFLFYIGDNIYNGGVRVINFQMHLNMLILFAVHMNQPAELQVWMFV